MISLSLPEASKLNLPIASLEDLCRRHAEYKVAEKHNDDDTQNAFIKYVLLYAMLACSVVPSILVVLILSLRDSVNRRVCTHRASIPAVTAIFVARKCFVQLDMGASTLQRQTTDQAGRESGRRGVRGRSSAGNWRRIFKAPTVVLVGCGALQARGNR